MLGLAFGSSSDLSSASRTRAAPPRWNCPSISREVVLGDHRRAAYISKPSLDNEFRTCIATLCLDRD